MSVFGRKVNGKIWAQHHITLDAKTAPFLRHSYASCLRIQWLCQHQVSQFGYLLYLLYQRRYREEESSVHTIDPVKRRRET